MAAPPARGPPQLSRSWEEVHAALRAVDAELEADAYLVGGVVRDQLLGLPSRDVDLVVVGMPPEPLLARLADRLGWPPPTVFERFATAHVAGDGFEVEAVRARAEAYEPTSRRPTVRPGTLLEDVVRRDFTVNTLCLRLSDGELLDLTGRGLSDLNRRRLDTPLDPGVTLAEDPLRILRAARLASTHGFVPEARLLTAMREAAPRLALISVERVAVELRRLLLGESAHLGLDLLVWGGAMAVVLPEAAAGAGTTQAAAACAPRLTTRLAALLSAAGAEAASAALLRLRFSRAEVDTVGALLRLHPESLAERAPALDDAGVRRLALAAGELAPALLDLAAALGARTDPGARAKVEWLAGRLAGLDPAGALAARRVPLDGRALGRVLGAEPGPAIGAAQRALLEAIAAGDIPADDPAAAERWLRARQPR